IINKDGMEISYRNLYGEAIKLSKKLLECNSNVLVLCSNKIEFAIASFACWFANKTVIPIDIRLSSYEINNIAQFCNANTVITEYEINTTSLEICNIIISEYTICSSSFDIIEDIYHLPINLNNNNAMLFPTTGTTSDPKYVILSHENIISEIECVRDTFNADKTTCELIIIPLTTVTGSIGQLLLILNAGGRLVLNNSKLNPKKLFDLIEKYEVSITGCSPTILAAILNYKRLNMAKIKSLKAILLGGEQVNSAQVIQFRKIMKFENIIPVYGLTEACSMVTGSMLDECRERAVSRVLPIFNLKICDQKGMECSLNTKGEIYISGPSVTTGYYRNERFTNQTIVDGWLKTGDIGYLDQDGYLYIVGRMKNIIIVAGKNVHTEEVEEFLISCPQILEAKAYSQPHEVLGEILAADIVVKKECSINKEEIINYCKKGLASYKIPQKINIVSKINTIGMGKKQRRQ
ncbi:MAG: class I adenylate-forming enzyme family protein, partial [Clostridiaceae bacterium]